jgi:ribosomal-protein-alanine N-acetyltransferase
VARTVRLARPTDAAVLAALDADASENPWSERQFLAVCSGHNGKGETVLVVDEDGRIDGFVVLSQVLDEASIFSIAIHPAQQGKGLGQMLLATAMLQVQRAGAARCLLEVRRSNTTARRLYQRNGFTLDGVRKNYYPTTDGREDALLMSRAF